VQSAADLTINTAGQDIDNRATAGSGGLLAAGKLQLDGGVLDNRGGAVNAQGDARLLLARVDNSGGGTLASSADLSCGRRAWPMPVVACRPDATST
jgi:filamentous hemagglutinin